MLHGYTYDSPCLDETTRNKIYKHLSDITDTISEEDLAGINTTFTREAVLTNKNEVEFIANKNAQADKCRSKKIAITWNIVS